MRIAVAADHPMMIDADRRQPWRLRRVLLALAYAPSSDAKDVLKGLPRRDVGFLREHDWINALERRCSAAAARVLLEFITEGAFSRAPGGEIWWPSRKLAGAMRADDNFRSEVYRQ